MTEERSREMKFINKPIYKRANANDLDEVIYTRQRNSKASKTPDG